MLGPSLLTPRRATVVQAAIDIAISKEGVLTGSYWGAVRATVKDGCFVVVRPFELDKHPSKMTVGLSDHVHNAARTRYPMVRVDWLCRCHLNDTSQCDDNRFVRVSWDGVFDMFYEESERAQKAHRPSVLPIASSWRSMGMLHNASGMLAKATVLYGSSVGTGGDYSIGAAQVIPPRVAGLVKVHEQ